MIEQLVAAGHAYVAEDHVLFAVPSMPDYGRLSKRPLDEMIAGARVEVAPYKRDADGLRAVEAVEAGRAGVAVAVRDRGAGPAGLAHRVLGDGVEASRRDLRHPRRRHRSRVPAPRERDRAVALRLPHAGDGELSGCTTASCRSKARRCRSASATSSRSAICCDGLAGRGAALQHAADALPPADRLDGEAGWRRAANTLERLGLTLEGHGLAMRSRQCSQPCSKRWPTISTRRRRLRDACTIGRRKRERRLQGGVDLARDVQIARASIETGRCSKEFCRRMATRRQSAIDRTCAKSKLV